MNQDIKETLMFCEMLLTNYSVQGRLGDDGKDCLQRVRRTLKSLEA